MVLLIKDILRRHELLGILINRNLKIRYKNSSLGFFWSLLTPLLMILIYSVFAGIMKWNMGRKDFLQFLVVGIVVWQFLVMCMNDSLSAIAGNSNLIKKTAFPRAILPLSTVLANLVNFLLTGVVLFVFLLIMKTTFRHVYLLPLVLLTQCALCLGLSLMISASQVFFKDTEHIIGVTTLAWFFLSPVFYSVSFQLEKVSDGLHWAAFLNPMTGILCSYRSILMWSTRDPFPGLSLVTISFSVSWVVLFLGVWIFRLTESKFADEL